MVIKYTVTTRGPLPVTLAEKLAQAQAEAARAGKKKSKKSANRPPGVLLRAHPLAGLPKPITEQPAWYFLFY